MPLISFHFGTYRSCKKILLFSGRTQLAIRERDWYGRDWKILRTQLVKLCLLHSDALLAGLNNSFDNMEELTNQFLEQIREDIAARISLDRLGLWQNCLSLLIQAERLCMELKRDGEALSGRKKNKGYTVHPRQALARKLNQFFEMNRREHVANELGVSSNKVKTWERLDRVSRKLAKNDTVSNRCTEEHFEALARYVKANHGHDKNLPRRAKTVKGYFYRFSDDCIENIENRDDTMDKLSLQEAKDLLQGAGITQLSKCLQQLSTGDLEIVDVSFQLELSQVVYRSLEDFLHNHKLTQEQFDKRRKQVLDKLQQCLEITLISTSGGHA